MKSLFIIVLLFLCARSQSQDYIFKWRQISGPIESTIVNPDSAYTLVTGLYLEGEYLFEFSVENMFGISKDTCKVTVLPGTVLSIDTTKPIIIERPKISKFAIQTLTRGDLIYVQVKSPKPQIVKIVIFNVLGQALAESNIPVKKGENIFTLPKPRQSGVYILRFFNNIISQSYKIVI